MRAIAVVFVTLLCCLSLTRAVQAAPSPASPASPASIENRGRGYFDFGVFAYEDGDFEDALQNLRKAVEMEPGNPLYHQYLGRTCMELRQFDEALAALTAARQAEPSLSGLTYDLALLHFKKEEYVDAAGLFESLLDQEPDHVLIRYYTAITLFKLKRYRAALPHFHKAVALSPSIRDNGSYYIGVCHFMLREYDRARELLTSVRDTAGSDTLRQSAAKWLATLENIRPWRLSLETIAGYDDNVVREPVDRPELFSKEGDYFAGAYLQGRYNFIDQRDWRAGVDFRHWQVKYRDLDEFDRAISFLQLSAAHRRDQLVFGLNYTPSYYWLDGQDFGLQQEIEPVVVWEIDHLRTARLSHSRAYNNYFDLPERVGHTDTSRLNIYQALPRHKALLYGELAVGHNDADHPAQDFDLVKAGLGLHLQAPAEFQVTLDSSVTTRDHRLAETGFTRVREDRRYYLAASVSRPVFYDWLALGVKVEYVNNDSNIDVFHYRKLAAFLSLVAAY